MPAYLRWDVDYSCWEDGRKFRVITPVTIVS